MTIELESSLKRGLPISLSRYTDVAHWYMPWLEDMFLSKQILPAFDPQKAVLSFWDVDPQEVHSLFFWTKYPPKLTEALTGWLKPYRVFTAITITGWAEVEERVPSLSEQMDALARHIDLVGPSKVVWRYSPVPVDFLDNRARQEVFQALCEEVASFGLEHVDVSMLQPSPHWSQGYAPEPEAEGFYRVEILKTLVDLASDSGLRVGVCADDLKWVEHLEDGQASRCFSTECLSRATLDQVFGLDTKTIPENGCRCQLSLDPCQGKQFGCPSACQYCYVPFTKVKGGR